MRTTPLSPRCWQRRSLLVSLLAALAVGCATTPKAGEAPPSAEAAPIFLWRATPPAGKPGQLLLLGSVHVQDPTQAALDRAIYQAFDQADELVVEVNTDAIDPALAQQLTLEQGFYPEGDQLSKHIKPETRALLEQRCQELGLAMALFERMRPWLAALTVTVMKMKLDGYSEQAGVDQMMISSAKAGQKPVRELESFAYQLNLFSDLSAEVQEYMLLDALYSSVPGRSDTDAILEAYRSGDLERAEAVFFDDLRQHPELAPLYQSIYADRNVRMVEKLQIMSAEPKTFLVTVGAAHLLGEEGIVSRLRRAGYTVERVPPLGVGEGGPQPVAVAPANWQQVRDQAAGFAVEFPDTPQAQQGDIPLEDQEMHVTSYTLNQIVLIFEVNVISYPESVAKNVAADPERSFDGGVAGWAKEIQGTVEESEKIVVDGHPGRRVRISSQASQQEGMLVVRDGDVYQVRVVFVGKGAADAERRKAADRFLSSFTLIDRAPAE